MRIGACLLFLAATAAQGARAQNWDRYRPGTLKAVTDQHDSSVCAGTTSSIPNLAISGDDFARTARVIFVGQHRPISPERVELLRMWVKAFRMDSSIIVQFPNEYLFREGGQEHWLPVQAVLEHALAQEAKPGQVIDLLVIFIGGRCAGGAPTWLFLVNEFDARASSG